MILSTFTLNILTLLISTGFQLFVYMAFDLAIAASCVLIVAGYIWYRHCSRIFNSLQFNEDNDKDLFRNLNSDSESRRRSDDSWGMQWLRGDNFSTETYRVGSIGSLYDRNHPDVEQESKQSMFRLTSNSFFSRFKSNKNSNSNGNTNAMEAGSSPGMQNRARMSSLALAADVSIQDAHKESLKIEARMHSGDML